MNMIQILRTGSLALATLMLTASPLFADDDRGRRHDDDRYEHRRGYGGMDGSYGIGRHYGGMGMRHGPIHMLDLSDSQRKKINAINDASRKKNWEVMGKMMDESARIRDLYAEDRLNVAKITATYDRIFTLQKKIIRDRLSARNQQYDLLNEKQRKELKKLRSKRGYGRHKSGGMMGR